MKKSRLTDIAIQKMKAPTQGRIEVMDEIVPRLALRIIAPDFKKIDDALSRKIKK